MQWQQMWQQYLGWDIYDIMSSRNDRFIASQWYDVIFVYSLTHTTHPRLQTLYWSEFSHVGCKVGRKMYNLQQFMQPVDNAPPAGVINFVYNCNLQWLTIYC